MKYINSHDCWILSNVIQHFCLHLIFTPLGWLKVVFVVVVIVLVVIVLIVIVLVVIILCILISLWGS